MKWKLKTISALVGLSFFAFAGTAYADTYQIRSGDTLWSISQSKQLSLSRMIQANPDLQPDNLQVGQSIQIPNKTYTIQSNDTFWSIARRLHVPLKTLTQVNPSVNPYNLYPGLTITLPPSDSASSSASYSAAASMAPAVSEARAAIHAVQSSAQGNVIQTPIGAKSFSKEINVKATAYTAAPSENGGYRGLDYLGHSLKLGTLAVDPSVIPLKSTVYIEGYSFDGLPSGGMIAHATDIGGAIKGNRVDIFVPTSRQKASDFGIQKVKVFILK